MNLNKLLLITLVSANPIFGQDIGITEVKVLAGFEPTIPAASRLNENATFADTIVKDRTQIYDVVDVDLKSDYKTKILAVAQVKDDKISELYGTMILVGLGSAFSTKANFIHNSRRSKTLSYGVITNHFANRYYVAKNSENSINMYAKKISSSYIFLANLDYDRRTSLYNNEKVNLEETDPGKIEEDNFFRNRFAFTKLSLSAFSKENSEQKLRHHTTFSVSDLNEFSENQIHLSSNLRKRINGLPYSLTIEFDDYLSYNNLDSKFDNSDLKIISLSPNTKFVKYGIDFDLGFDSYFFSNESSISFFPKIKATKELVKNILLVYGGLSHSEKKHTLKSLSDDNPYIHSFGMNQSILGGSSFLQSLNQTDIHELYLGLRNRLSSGEIFEGSIAYGLVKNLAHFISVDYHNYSRFQVTYIDVKQLHVIVNYTKKVNETISLNANTDYFNWNLDVYHKSNLNAGLRVLINLRNKIKVTPSLTYMSNRKAINYSVSHLDHTLNNPILNSLSFQTHINLGISYSYSKQLSMFLQLNNISNSKKDLWLNYREVGFNGIFGINYSF
jgi:hypothetical protein